MVAHSSSILVIVSSLAVYAFTIIGAGLAVVASVSAVRSTVASFAIKAILAAIASGAAGLAVASACRAGTSSDSLESVSIIAGSTLGILRISYFITGQAVAVSHTRFAAALITLKGVGANGAFSADSRAVTFLAASIDSAAGSAHSII